MVNPTGVRLSDYAATVSTSPPPCPTSTAGGWVIDGYAPLPTMVAGAVSAGMTAEVSSWSAPQGSIVAESFTGQPSSTYESLVVPSGSSVSSSRTQSASSSATSQGSAGRALGANPSAHGYGILGMTTALMGLGAAVVVWL